mmetsp:Transcript_71628/g.203234  ORF Transcript_71628/g.203234 Transcript_71628/m.203234 type:complete len:104 (+) Transcript_71628:81-392(+)
MPGSATMLRDRKNALCSRVDRQNQNCSDMRGCARVVLVVGDAPDRGKDAHEWLVGITALGNTDEPSPGLRRPLGGEGSSLCDTSSLSSPSEASPAVLHCQKER